MKRRNPVMQAAFRSGAGAHKRCRSGERQHLRSSMEDAIDEYFAECEEGHARGRDTRGNHRAADKKTSAST